MTTDVRRQFPLATDYFSPRTREWRPPASHDEAEAQRRREGPEGLLVLEQQAAGARIAPRFIRRIVRHGTQGDIFFGSRIISAALFGSARMSLEGGARVTRRHFDLPLVADPETDKWLTSREIIAHTVSVLGTTALQSENVRSEKQRRGAVALRTEHRFGHTAGEAALWAALLPHAELSRGSSAQQTQERVLEIGMDALEWSRELGETTGANPSLAGLAGPEASELNVYIERSLSHGAVNMYREARHAILG